MQLPDWLAGVTVSAYPSGDRFIKLSGNAGAGVLNPVEHHWDNWPEDVQQAVINASLVVMPLPATVAVIDFATVSKGVKVKLNDDGDILVRCR